MPTIRQRFVNMDQRDWSIFALGLIVFLISSGFLVTKYINLPI